MGDPHWIDWEAGPATYDYDIDGSVTIAFSNGFTGDGRSLDKCIWYLRGGAGTVGNAYAKIYNGAGSWATGFYPTGSPLATSDPVDVTPYTVGKTPVTFNFSTPFTPLLGAHYVLTIEYNATYPYFLNVGYVDGTEVNSYYKKPDLSWNNYVGLNWCFYVMSNQTNVFKGKVTAMCG